jgi:prepilin-type N-terminal cleavage/methylation domain-containing protein
MLTRLRKGFTLIELLVVISIIGLLATALVPAVKAVKKSARKAQAKSVFAQWATACTLYKKEYGAYLPNLGSAAYDPSKDILHKLDDSGRSLLFIKHLYGKNLNGTALSSGTSGERVKYNRQAMEFCAFGQDDFLNYSAGDTAWQANPILQDRLGNPAIRVCFDLNNDGLIKSVAGTYPVDLTDAAGTTGVPGRIIIFTTDLDIGTANPDLSPSDAADIFVIQ